MSFLAALPAIVGAAGSLIKGKTPKAQQMAEAAMAAEQARYDEYMKMVRGYDPAAENASAIDFAQKSGAKTLEGVLKTLGARAAKGGPADTNILFSLQRAQDSVLNPLAAMTAERKSNEYLQKLDAMGRALQLSPSGRLADNYMQMVQGSQDNLGPALSMFSTGVDNLLSKPKAGTNTPSTRQDFSGSKDCIEARPCR